MTGKPKHRAGDAPQQAVVRVRVDDPAGDWPNSGAVAEALLREWMEHGQSEMLVLTAGRPTGAEQMARTIAGQRGWAIIVGDPHVPEDVLLTFNRNDVHMGAEPAGRERTVKVLSYTVSHSTAIRAGNGGH